MDMKRYQQLLITEVKIWLIQKVKNLTGIVKFYQVYKNKEGWAQQPILFSLN